MNNCKMWSVWIFMFHQVLRTEADYYLFHITEYMTALSNNERLAAAECIANHISMQCVRFVPCRFKLTKLF